MPKLGMQSIRRRQLIDATLEAINEVGMHDATIAQIARRAGVSTGIISHYFRDKNGLLEATMRDITSQLRDAVLNRLHALPQGSAEQRLQAIVGGNFDETQVSSAAMKAWLAFWASSMHQPMLYRLQQVSSRRLLSNLVSEFRRELPRQQAQEAGYGLAALIDGLWLRAALSGKPLDLDNWAQEPGLENWSYLDCLPYYRKAETRDVGENDYHGGDGPVSVTTSKPGVNPLFEAMIEAGVQAGYPRTDDLNGYQQEGFGPMDRTVTPQGRRASTARGYLDQAKSRPNLTIRTHAMTDHIIFDGKRAVGVEWLEGDSTIPTRATANKEVLLCAGAIASPQILQRSGVGNAELLAEFDIPLVHELPGVGENLQDHLEMYLQYECKEPVSLYPALQWWNQPKIGAEWLFGGTGVGASNHFEAGGFIRSREEFAWPNIQYHFLPVAINYNGSNAVKEHGFQCHVGSMRSPSRGHVRIKSRDPHQHPAILFNYMSHEQDWQEFRDAIRITREIMHQPALDQYRGREISPGVECQTDEQLDEFVRNHAETAFHPCGTCKMGYDEMSVVDGEGRVHGLEGLRVVDASIMPQIITGNLNATTIMIGEKIADMIRGQEALPRSTAGYFVANGMPVRAKK
ncbi:choline dehydrogenase [Escherichia coli]|nr:choline dehydrogenase [Escherichia coli]